MIIHDNFQFHPPCSIGEEEPYLAEMFLARSLSSVATDSSDRPPFKMAAVTINRNFFKWSKLLYFKPESAQI
jgi:hypothetical protein